MTIACEYRNKLLESIVYIMLERDEMIRVE
jgi:hypothetical protein